MKKKIVIIAICIVSFVAGIMFSKCIPTGSAADDGINRAKELIYPLGEYMWDNYVCICPDSSDKYYHESRYCGFFPLHLDELQMSRYEAVERGYQACPNCYRPETMICYQQWMKMIKEE